MEQPLAPVIIAIPLRQDHILHIPRNILRIAVVHLACEEVDTLDPEQHQQEGRDGEQVGDARDRVQERDDLDLEPEVPLEHAKGAQDAQDAENFEDFQVEAGDDDGDERDEHDDEIEQVPVVFQVAGGAVEKEALHDDVDGAFKCEKDGYHDVYFGQELSLIAVLVIERVFKDQQDCGDDDKGHDRVVVVL